MNGSEPPAPHRDVPAGSKPAPPVAGRAGDGAAGDPHPAPPATTRQLLRRELVAIGVLYLVQSLLPLLIGLAFAP